MHVDNNFPAAFQVLAFLGSAMLGGVLLLATVYGFARSKDWALRALAVLAAGIVVYLVVLLGFSLASREMTLGRGEEKYFCEIDCHLAYSVVSVAPIQLEGVPNIEVTLRTRFDEQTISAHRPKSAPLTPAPRQVVLIDAAGRHYAPTVSLGTPLQQQLIPGQSYTTTLIFPVAETKGMRLLITSPDGPVPLLIDNEMSLAHKKTYLGL